MNVRRLLRRVGLAVGLVALIVVIAVLAFFTIDVGPAFRARAEQAGSKWLSRPMHIGRLGIRLARGEFVVEDLRIDGPTPSDHPFFVARQINVSLFWWRFLRTREVLIKSIDMSDWDMQVEMKNGVSSFIKLPKSSGARKSYTVTLEEVHASRGRFTYIDYGAWRTTSPNLDVTVSHATGEYRGRASFSDGTVQIKDYLPMRSDMRCSFRIDGGKVHLNWIDLKTDGAQTVVAGDVDFRNWPEMFYRVRSHVDFARMRQIFFAREKFRLGGEGEFTGTFHLYKGGRELKGSFASPLLLVNTYRFPDFTGNLRWLPDRLDVTDGSARFYSGTSHFTYTMAPLGAPRPAIARFDASYENVNLSSVTDDLRTKGMRLAGRASGRNLLEWPLGKFGDHRGEGEIIVRAPANARLYTSTSAPLAVAGPAAASAAGTPSTPAASADATVPTPAPVSYVGAVPNLGYVPMAGTIRYQYGPEWVEVGPSSVSTPATYIEFGGRTAYGERSSLDFYARSGDWQQSDNLLSAIITAFGSPTRTVIVGGYGEFSGRMLNSFRRPRIEGAFNGHDVRAFDVLWGNARGQVIIDDGYVNVTNGVVTKAQSELRADGRFSLSTPRRDGGEEINARVRLSAWPLPDLRHAFDLDAYPIDGRVGGEYHVYGAYRRPFGFGQMLITDGVAYSEPFERGVGSMRLEGTGVRIDGIEIAKGGGTITGAAYVSWDGKYSFNADTGRRIPVEQIALLKFPRAPLSGLVSFRASGSGSFASPRYELNYAVADLFVGDEGIGQVKGTLNVRDQVMGLAIEAASPRLAVSGTGRVALKTGADAELSFSVTDTSLDPYIRALNPGLSPFTQAVASGTVHVRGQLTNLDRLLVDANVERLTMRLFDYEIRNAAPMRLSLDANVLHLGEVARGEVPAVPMQLVGRDTRLSLSGDVNLGQAPYVEPRGSLLPGRSVAIRADGDANLGILQGFFRDIRSSGRAVLKADIDGSLDQPTFSGNAVISDGRIRYFSLPHSIDAINGPITFTAGAIRFGDPRTPLTAQVGGGPVTFGGRIDLNGFTPSQWAITATGENLHLRYPEGFNSIVDADLSLVGPYASPALKGTVNVRSAVFERTLDITPSLLAAASTGATGGAAAANAAPAAPSFPLRFDVQILAPSALRVQTNMARLVASANFVLRGTYDHPVLLGRADVDRGYATIEGNRYLVTRGAIEFNNPTRIEPFFDVETETRVRAPGQTYIVTLHLVGTMRKLTWEITSDPPLPQVDVVSLLFGDVRSQADVQNAELRALQRPNATQQQIVQTRLEQFLLSPLSSNVGRVFEKTFGLDTFQITPSLFDAYQRLNPTARLTIGKQISSRVYLTISRSVYSPQEDIIYLLEFDQSDRVSWVLSRNEDKTYALDVRVRHTF